MSKKQPEPTKQYDLRTNLTWWGIGVLVLVMNLVNAMRGVLLNGVFERNLRTSEYLDLTPVKEVPESLRTQAETVLYTYPVKGYYLSSDAKVMMEGANLDTYMQAGLGFALIGVVYGVAMGVMWVVGREARESRLKWSRGCGWLMRVQGSITALTAVAWSASALGVVVWVWAVVAVLALVFGGIITLVVRYAATAVRR